MNTYHKIHGLFKRYTEGEKKGKFIIGQYSRPEFELLKDIKWVWTEKIDATNVRVCYYSNPLCQEVEFKGETDRAKLPKHLVERLKELFTVKKMEKIFGVSEEKPDVCLYGEGFGYKIQSGGKYVNGQKRTDFVLFDIKIDNTWLKRVDVEDIASQLGLLTVPIIGVGTIEEAINYVKSDPMSILGNHEFVSEGLVIRPQVELLDRRGHRIITKIKVKDFKEE